MVFIVMLLLPCRKLRVVFRQGLKGTDFSLLQSHQAAEGNRVWICLKDCRDDLTQSTVVPLLSSFSITFFTTLSKATDFV